jgi:hypothetical protein
MRTLAGTFPLAVARGAQTGEWAVTVRSRVHFPLAQSDVSLATTPCLNNCCNGQFSDAAVTSPNTAGIWRASVQATWIWPRVPRGDSAAPKRSDIQASSERRLVYRGTSLPSNRRLSRRSVTVILPMSYHGGSKRRVREAREVVRLLVLRMRFSPNY